MNLVVTDAASPEDTNTVTGLLVAYNEQQAGLSARQPLAVLLKGDDLTTVGGLIGATSRNYLHVALLVVDPALRGQDWGTRLLQAAEAEAINRGCTHVYLDTFSFQALPFYEKHGYRVFGTLPDFPPGHSRYFLTKTL